MEEANRGLAPTLSRTLETASGAFSRPAFIEFLSLSHCLENLDFILETDKFMDMSRQLHDSVFFSDAVTNQNSQLLLHWKAIFNTFLDRDAVQELNIPASSVSCLNADILPSQADLTRLRKLVRELLQSNYNDFLYYVRENSQLQGGVRRRFLESVAPDHLCRPVAQAATRLPLNTNQDLAVQWDEVLDIYESAKLESDSNITSRAGSAGTVSTRPSSRGLSFGSIFENLKDYASWKKTVKILRPRRASLERREYAS